MSNEDKNNVIYVCSLIEYIARATKNKVADIVKILGKKEIERQLMIAEVNHSLSFEQVSDELIEKYGIQEGNFDSVGNCIYKVPKHVDIGKNYYRLIEDVIGNKSITDTLYEVMTSFLAEKMSNYNSSLYYSSREYLRECYIAGMILD
ncbi:hypothetical protein [Wukongibacter sp. M2B1]|uniref:hypothetical protein n=1 Tax=Wukongibacter sp. M2B1 TaxID=3088895 RepID=UPI003D7BB1B1